MMSVCRTRVLLMCVLACVFDQTLATRRTTNRRPGRLSAPLDVELLLVNCTAFRVQWRISHHHTNTITGYRVFYVELKNDRPVGPVVSRDVPLSADTHIADMVIENLKVASQYRVSVAAFDREGQGRPSVPRVISTSSQEVCLLPAPPTQPIAVPMSDTEMALSWQQGESEGSSPVLHFLVAYIRPELDSDWTLILEPVESNSMVLKGLIPQTEYQFMIRSVNQHGISTPSPTNPPVWTLSEQHLGSGDQKPCSSDPQDGDDDGFAIDDSDYDIFTDELTPFSDKNNNRRSQLRSHSNANSNANGRVIYRMRTPQNTPVQLSPPSKNTPASSNKSESKKRPESRNAPVLQNTPPSKNTPVLESSNVSSVSGVWTSTILPTAPTPPTTAPPPPTTTPSISQRRAEPRVYDTSCDETVCPSDSFCINDYNSGGSRCHCNLGRHGDVCSEGVSIRFPKFYGYSHMTFEPLKNSYRSFQITLEFKADSEDGLLLFCGDSDHGAGDFTSLALIRRKLHYRFNCGTGAGQINSESSIVIGRWHTVTIFRDGVNGWLRLDNDTPVSGRSQGRYSKITFRTPLFVGGAPSAYWLVKAVGTNRGFRGCVQSLSINGRDTDLRPWPRGHALSGGDIGECSTSVCDKAVCENGGVCYPTRTNSSICLCPLGYRGVQCEESFVLTLPQFSESLNSYYSAPWPPSQSYLSFMEFHITFKPTNQDGTLLYSHDAHSRDFLSIILVGGVVQFRFDCGSGAAVISSEKPVIMNTWHELRVCRTSKSGILQVDDQQPVEGSTEGAFTQIKCTSPLYVGGVPDYDNTKSSAGVLRAFSGDIQRITLNDRVVAMETGHAEGVNVMNAVHPCVENPCSNGGTCRAKRDQYDCDCPLGYDGTHCQKECGNYCFNLVTEAIETPQFTGRSYLTYDNEEILKRVSGSRNSVFLRFKSWSKDGLLLWRGENPVTSGSDYLSVGLQEGELVFSYNLGSGAVMVVVNGSFSDGRWHRVKAVRDGPYGKLTVDDYGAQTGRSPGNMRQLNINGDLYIGGMKEIAVHTHRQYLAGLVGCISHFTLASDYHVSLVEDAADGKNINTCSN